MELMCCVVIFSLLTAIASPFMMHLRSGISTRTVAYQLMGDLQLAKLTAIKYNCNVAVSFYLGGYIVFVDDGNGGGISSDWVRQDNEQLLVQRTFSPGLTTSLSYTNNRLRFDGTIGMWPGTIRIISIKGDNYAVKINNCARLRLVKESS
jgi:Tfp pilus assembly protein FimT